MKAQEYRKLVSTIMRLHGRRLNLLRVDAAEMADHALFGRMTSGRVLELAAATEE